MNEFYKDLEKIKNSMTNFLGSYSKSKVIQDYFFQKYASFVYGTLMQNFFNNLTHENIVELHLPDGKNSVIKDKFKQERKHINLTLSLKPNKINKKYYISFKKRVKREFPEFCKIISVIEKTININQLNKHLSKTKSEFKKSGKSDTTLSDTFTTKFLEVYIKKKKSIPSASKISQIMKTASKGFLPAISKLFIKNLNKTSSQMLNYERKYQKDFEKRLLLNWKEAIDLLECLIKVSLETAGEHKSKLAKVTNNTNNYKHEALIKIHARALHIANEILVLLKSGYADGANARWRSLRELAVISFFLSKENNEISQRYLDYADVRAFKEAKNYREHCKKLGYKQIDLRVVKKMKKRVEDLDKKYGDNFGNLQKNGRAGDYNWIPKNTLKNRNFTELEKHIKVNHLHPFYNSASDAIHAGSKGFYRIGLMHDWQDKVFLVGHSIYGLADPLQNTAVSLLQISVCLLSTEPDFDGIIQMHVMNYYVSEIGPKSVKLQKQIEKDEKNRVIVLAP